MNMFKIPEKIIFGENSLDTLKNIEGKKQLLLPAVAQ